MIDAIQVGFRSQENRAIGMGVFFSYYYLGIGLFPALAGWMRDITGSPGVPLVLAGTLFISALVFLGLFRFAETRH